MSNAKARPPRLGRGLSSLMARAVEVAIPPAPPPKVPETPLAAPPKAASVSQVSPVAVLSPTAVTPRATPIAPQVAVRPNGLIDLPVASIRPNPHQPRQQFDEAALHQLAESIRTDGLMQPVIVRPAPGTPAGKTGGVFELVAGERRWRAAQIAGLQSLPAIVRELDDRQIAEWALIENLQREDLNPIERAEAFQHLMTTFKLNHDQIAARVGIERSSVSNSLRLLNLCDSVRQLIRGNLISSGQAKVLAGIADPSKQTALAQRAVKQDWSVRQLEQTARLIAPADMAAAPSAAPTKAPRSSPHLADLEEQIGKQLSTKARIKPGRKKGTGSLTIDFYSIDQFDAILAKLGVETES